MKKYIKKTEVYAEPMTAGDAEMEHIYTKHAGPDDEGYKVMYHNGMCGWMSQRLFESGYKPYDSTKEKLEVELDELKLRQHEIDNFVKSEEYKSMSSESQELVAKQIWEMKICAKIIEERISLG